MTREELLKALQEAKDGDGKLSWVIAEHLGWTKYWNSVTIFLPPGATEQSGPWHEKPPAFTTSHDAALSLIPEGWVLDISERDPSHNRPRPQRWTVWLMKTAIGVNDAVSRHDSLPIAICLAALEARPR